ncbi:MAG: hypothetical protein MZV70_01565 [Desulfobacterales bacterium]|nr:hypothetical protein [Desulfobacterales bacterium]
MTKLEREENLRGAFYVNPKFFANKKLLLMDDICTSGATLKELIKTLQRENVREMQVLVGSNSQSLIF